MSKCLIPDQDLHFVCPDLGQNCLQRLSADDKGKELSHLYVFSQIILFRCSACWKCAADSDNNIND